MNNLGYVLMAAGKIDLSRSMLLRSISLKEKENNISALPNYNLAVLIARENNLEESIRLLKIAKDIAEKMPSESLSCSSLFVPVVNKGKLDFIEVLDPNLFDTINDALSVLEKISKADT